MSFIRLEVTIKLSCCYNCSLAFIVIVVVDTDLSVFGADVQQPPVPVTGGQPLPVPGVLHQPGHNLLPPVLKMGS